MTDNLTIFSKTKRANANLWISGMWMGELRLLRRAKAVIQVKHERDNDSSQATDEPEGEQDNNIQGIEELNVGYYRDLAIKEESEEQDYKLHLRKENSFQAKEVPEEPMQLRFAAKELEKR